MNWFKNKLKVEALSPIPYDSVKAEELRIEKERKEEERNLDATIKVLNKHIETQDCSYKNILSFYLSSTDISYWTLKSVIGKVEHFYLEKGWKSVEFELGNAPDCPLVIAVRMRK